MANLAFAFRMLVKTPVVTTVAVVSLGLGIGANAASFSLFNQLLLRPLPVHEPERLVNLAAPGPKPGSDSCNQAGGCDEVFSYPIFRDLQREQAVFADVAAHRRLGVNVAYARQTISGDGMLVSGSYFSTLGLVPALGRLLGPEVDSPVGGHPVVVLSHDFWRSRLGADPAVLDDAITVNGRPMTIVGVAPAGFRGTTIGAQPLLFVPIAMRGELVPGFDAFEDRRNYWVYLFARLKPGVSIAQAHAGLEPLYRALLTEVEAPLQVQISEQTLAQFVAKPILVEDGRLGQSSVDEWARAPLILLFTVTAIVLLIACANVANLLLARSAARGPEMAVRLSLGATRRHLLTQLLTESLLLALVGGVIGLLVARWTLAVIGALLPPEAVSTVDLTLDLPAVLFAMAVSLGTGVLFGMFPALHSTRSELLTTLKNQAGQPSGARAAARFRTALVTAQFVLSMALLIAAGLFIRSLANVSRIELGIRTEDVVTFRLSPELNGYEPQRMRALYERLEAELDIEIVGLVRDTRYSDVKRPVPPVFYWPYRQDESLGGMTFYARTTLSPGTLLQTVPTVMAGLDPQLPVNGLKTLPQQVRENVFLDRMIGILSTAFALIATLLAAVGLYGVLAYSVTQRTREIGLRMALGADARRVRAMVLGEVGRITLVGGVAGIAAALGTGRFARSLLFEIEATDPTIVVMALVALGAVGFGAGFVPALRASRVDAMRALRYE